jgi:protein translocase SecG subunit
MPLLWILHIVVSVLLVGSVLLQAGESSFLSSSGLIAGGEHFHTRRGIEKVLFYGTFLWLGLFLVLSILLLR